MRVQALIGILVALGVALAPMHVVAASGDPIPAPSAVLDEGIGVQRNYAQLFQRCARGAELGHAEAMNCLGVLYAMGRGVPQDYVAAFAWYLRAAKHGAVSSASNIATAYVYGQGVPQSYSEAVKWLQPAAAQGDGAAQNKLGVLYNEGLGATKDPAKALALFQLSAGQGHSPAMANLGSMHANGRGAQRDDVRAYALISTALEIGVPASARDASLYQLGALAERLDEKRLARAQQLARELYTAATQPAPPAAHPSVDAAYSPRQID
jgi:TPR repeat protein